MPDQISKQPDARNVLVDLLILVGQDNKSAFAELYALSQRKLFGVALGILRDRALAEEALQEAYLKIWRNAGGYHPAISSPISWMSAIVRHAAIDVVRKRRLEAGEADSEMPVLPSCDPDPLEEIAMLRIRPLAMAAFADLSPEKRELISLAYIRRHSRGELSKRYGVPENTIKTNLRRSLLELRAKIEQRSRDAALRRANALARDAR